MRKLIRHDIGLSVPRKLRSFKDFYSGDPGLIIILLRIIIELGMGQSFQVSFLYCFTIQNIKFVVENFLGGNFFTPKFVATSREGNHTNFECIVEMRKLKES